MVTGGVRVGPGVPGARAEHEPPVVLQAALPPLGEPPGGAVRPGITVRQGPSELSQEVAVLLSLPPGADVLQEPPTAEHEALLSSSPRAGIASAARPSAISTSRTRISELRCRVSLTKTSLRSPVE